MKADTGIVQVVRSFHTGSSADHRLFTQPEFEGEVESGAEYIIVDDHITQGGTVNALRDHIESNGGKVVAVSALTLSHDSSTIAPRKETLDETRRKWPDIDRLLRNAGIADRADALTESQLRYINKFSTDGFRGRIAQEVKQRVLRAQYETLGAPSEGVARLETVTERDFTEDDYNRILGRNPRSRVRVRYGKPIDLVTGYAARTMLGGTDVSVEDMVAKRV